MRSPHHLHGVFDVAPLSGFFGVALVLASFGILGRLDDSLKAVLLEHLTRDHVNLYFRYHVALLMFHHARNRRGRCLSAARSMCRSTGSLDPSGCARNFTPPHQKRGERLARFSSVSGETTPLLPDCGSSSAKSLRIDGPTSQLGSALGCPKQ